MRTLEDALKSNEEQPEDKTANAERLKVSGSTNRSNGVQDSSEEFDIPDGNDVEGSHNLAQVISGYRTVPRKFFSSDYEPIFGVPLCLLGALPNKSLP